IENMESHGGWILAAPDYAKVLAAFDEDAANPLLKPATVQTMWSSPAPAIYPNLLRGWFKLTLPDSAGHPVDAYQHNGGLDGTSTLIVRRQDKLSFVLFFNKNI